MSPGSNPASFRDHRHNLPQSQHTTYDNAAEESGAVQLSETAGGRQSTSEKLGYADGEQQKFNAVNA